MSGLTLILPWLLLWSVVCFGAETNQERGKRVIDEALAVLGGKNFPSHARQSRNGRAYSFYREELSGLSIATFYTRYLTRPSRPYRLSSASASGKRSERKKTAQSLFTENDAFEVTFRGARPIPADRYARFRESTLRDILYIIRQRLGEPGLTIESRHAT